MSTIVNKIELIFSKNGLVVKGLNATRVVLFHLHLSSKRLIRYYAFPINNSIKVGVDLNVLLKGIKGVKNSDVMDIEIDLENKKFIFNIKKAKRAFRYTVNEFYVIEQDTFDIPKMEYVCEALLETKHFADIISELNAIGDTIRIGVDYSEDQGDNILYFSSENEICKGLVTITNKDADISFNMKRVKKRRLNFSTKYLSTLAKAGKIGDYLLLQLPKQSNPLSIIYKIGNMGKHRDEGHFKFYIAPFVDDEMNLEEEGSDDEMSGINSTTTTISSPNFSISQTPNTDTDEIMNDTPIPTDETMKDNDAIMKDAPQDNDAEMKDNETNNNTRYDQGFNFNDDDDSIFNSVKPGVKISFTQKAYDYMINQIIPYYKSEIIGMTIQPITETISTPIGKITFYITHFKITKIDVDEGSLKISPGNALVFHDDSIKAWGKANWRYVRHGWPKIEDKGTFDAYINIWLNMEVISVIDEHYHCHMREYCKSFKIGFKDFRVTMHGGESWLYNIIVGALKSTIETKIKDTVKKKVPPILTKSSQKSLDTLDFVLNISSDGVSLSYIPLDLRFDNVDGYSELTCEGVYFKDKIFYPGNATEMPDIRDKSRMISIFYSEFSANSMAYVFNKVGDLSYTLIQSDIPKKVEIKLNTSYFYDYVPKLFQKFPNRLMQIPFNSISAPVVNMKKESGIVLYSTFDTIFQVIQKNQSVINAFTIEVSMKSTVSVTVDRYGKSQYYLKGEIDFGSITMTLKETIIGKFDVSALEPVMKDILTKIIIPKINVALERTNPLPNVKGFKIVSPTVYYDDTFFEIRYDCTFSP